MWGTQTKISVMRSIKLKRWKAGAWPWLGERCKQGLQLLWHGMGRFWEFCSLKARELEMNSLLSRRHDKLHELGERVYQLYRRGEQNWEIVLPLCEELEEMDVQFTQLKASTLSAEAGKEPARATQVRTQARG